MPGGKVGGVGDVIRDLPSALLEQGWQPTVLTPSYGSFSQLPGATRIQILNVPFAGRTLPIELFDVPGADPRTRNVAFEHPLFSPQGHGKVYCADDSSRPFATDASKFALLCAAAATWIAQLDQLPDVVHLHDWHAALYLLLREYSPGQQRLRAVRTVFTIHNLAYQGLRPYAGDSSSLDAWFPGLPYAPDTVADPRYADCYNPMAAAIRLADRISTVSPSYAKEILLPDDPARGFIGGEGLDNDLRMAAQQNRLVGILNGCEYPTATGRRPGWQRVVAMAADQLTRWQMQGPEDEFARLAARRLGSLPQRRPRHVLVSVGRLVAQKAALFLEPLGDGKSALEHILESLGRRGVLIMLGSGEPPLEQQILAIAETAENLVFLRGYSDPLADALYRSGNLFLMPSSFEPCGISQMLAMRAGQPCVVHHVGGLRDTVAHDINGFAFEGDTPTEQAGNFVATVNRALRIRTEQRDRWQAICRDAAAARFDWTTSASETVELLYANTD